MPSGRTPATEDLFPFNALRASLIVLAAITLFPVLAAFVAAAAPRLAVLQHRSMPALAANHLITLGWGTLVAIGALHQMLPAVAGVRRDLSPRIPAQLALHLAGTSLLAAGFYIRSHWALLAGGSAIVVSVALLLAAAGATIRTRRRALPALRYVAAALICLGATVVWGLVLAANWKFVFSHALLRPAGLAVHLSLGLIGWFGFLIVGVSYYLLPRFAGLRTAPASHETAVFYLLAAGILALLGGVLSATSTLTRAGMLLVGAGGLTYTFDLARLLRAWPGTKPDITRAHWWVLAVETAALAGGSAAWALGILPGAGLRWGVAGVTMFLLGWVTLAITGQAYKVTPFLMWYYRFYAGLSAYEVPRLEAPYWPRAAVPSFVLLGAAAPLIAAGALTGSRAVAGAGGAAFLAGAISFSLLLGYSWLPVIWRGRRRSEPVERQ